MFSLALRHKATPGKGRRSVWGFSRLSWVAQGQTTPKFHAHCPTSIQ
jgi:hypothetical protein